MVYTGNDVTGDPQGTNTAGNHGARRVYGGSCTRIVRNFRVTSLEVTFHTQRLDAIDDIDDARCARCGTLDVSLQNGATDAAGGNFTRLSAFASDEAQFRAFVTDSQVSKSPRGMDTATAGAIATSNCSG